MVAVNNVPQLVDKKGDDIMESVISCDTAKATWTDLVYSFEGPLNTKENRIIDLKLEYQTFRAKPTESLSQTYTYYKTLLNELANDGVNLSKHEINDFQENSDDEVDERSSEEYLRDLDIKFHERSLLANSKRFIIRINNFSGQKANENIECYKCGKKSHFAKDCFSKTSEPSYKSLVTGYSSVSKAKLALLEANPSMSQNPKTFQPKNKGLVVKTFDWDEEEVSDDEEVTQVKVLMALVDDELTVRKNHASNGIVTISETEPTTPLVPTKVKYTEQESKINELTKLVQMLIDEKVNSTKKTQESNSQIQHAESSKSVDSSKISRDSKPKVQISGSSKSLRPKPIYKPQLKSELWYYTKNSTDDCYRILYSMICKKEDHRTSDHEMYISSLKRTENYKAQPYPYASPSKQILKAKAKPLPPCTHYSFNNHIPDDCRNYLECEICGCYDHFTSGHNRVIHIRGGVLAESS
ncbi:retrovirus-related pol polyprotein from transposon TNT 1-94 [Tanacetum coccineum]